MHLTNADSIKVSENAIKMTSKELESLNQQNYKTIHKEANELQKMVLNMEKMEKEYDKQMKEVDSNTTIYRNALSEYAEAKKKAELSEKSRENIAASGQTAKNVDKGYLKSIKDAENVKAKVEKVHIV